MISLETRIPPPAVLVAAAVVNWAMARMAPALAFPFAGREPLALALGGLGGLGGVAGILTFRRAATTTDPHRPEAASTLVITGIYRITRNPMYLGLLLVLMGWSVWLANATSVVGLALFVAWITRFQIRPEERALRAAFGEPYDRYRAATRRWI